MAEEDNLSDASLIEDEDEDDLSEFAMEAEGGSTNTDDTPSVINLPGEPITAPVGGQETLRPDLKLDRHHPSQGVWSQLDEGENDEPDFHGWTDDELARIVENIKTKDVIPESLERDAEFDETWINNCISIVTKGHFETPKSHKRGQNKRPMASSSASNTPKAPPKVPKRSSVTITPPAVNRRESREWRPSGVLFKPLTSGWVREVIYKQDDSGNKLKHIPPTIKYHAPLFPGIKPRVFKSTGELQAYLNASEPTLSWHNFSFRQEIMGAPEGKEIVHGENENVEIFPKKPEVQVKKPEKKLAAEKNGKSGLKVKVFSKMGEKNSFEKPAEDQILTPNLPSVQITKISTSANSPTPKASVDSSASAVSPSSASVSVTSKLKAKAKQTSEPKPNYFSKQPSWTSSASKKDSSTLGKAILRPTHSKYVSCSIHCTGINGFPTLSCVSCHSMFHPVCVGLADGMDYGSQFDFYCTVCQPPSTGKENSNPFSHSPDFVSGHSYGTKSVKNKMKIGHSSATRDANYSASFVKHQLPKGLPKGLSIIPSQKNKKPSNVSPDVNGAKSFTRRKPSVPKPIENQCMVNIAGIKYLIVPNLPSAVKPRLANNSKKQQQVGINTKLPYLLMPSADHGDMPTFEVEETLEGKLLLVPVKGPIKKGDNPFKKSEDNKEEKSVIRFESDPMLVSKLNLGYEAMLKVFRYLTLHDKIIVSRVCKFWRDLAIHPSLWKSISLKNVLVTDWKKFVKFANSRNTSRLDLRKLSHDRNNIEESLQIILDAFQNLDKVTVIELPQTPCSFVPALVKACPQIESIYATSISPKELNLGGFEKIRGLKELKLKPAAGRMKITGSLLAICGLASTLIKLSLLSVDSISQAQLEAIAMLSSLQVLEIGDCSKLESFQPITALTSLSSIRLEGCSISSNLAELRWLGKLEKLELIDAQLKEGFGESLIKLIELRKFLLIPSYTDEVASINAEMVDSVMSMTKLSFFILGLTNEWLESMSSLLVSSNLVKAKAGKNQKDSFPIMVNGMCEMYSLSKLSKTISTAMPRSRVKILKMSRNATGKQFINTLCK